MHFKTRILNFTLSFRIEEIFLLGFLLCGSAWVFPSQDSDNLVFLITSGQKTRNSYLENFSAQVTIQCWEMNRTPPEDSQLSSQRVDKETEMKIDIRQWGGKRFCQFKQTEGYGNWEKESFEPLTKKRPSFNVKAAFDGHSITRRRYENGQSLVASGDTLTRENPGVNLFILFFTAFHEISGDPAGNEFVPLDEFLSRAFDPETIKVDRKPSDKIEVQGTTKHGRRCRLLFDAGKDCALLERIDEYDTPQGIKSCRRVWKYQQMEKGYWYPEEMREVYSKPNGEPQCIFKVKIDSISFLEPPDSAFDVDFIPGDTVYDARTDMKYKVDEASRLIPISLSDPKIFDSLVNSTMLEKANSYLTSGSTMTRVSLDSSSENASAKPFKANLPSKPSDNQTQTTSQRIPQGIPFKTIVFAVGSILLIGFLGLRLTRNR